MARYKGLARGGILQTLDLVAQVNPASPDQAATGFSSASKTGNRLTITFDRQSSALGQLMGSASTYWFVDIPARWDLTRPWQETVLEITEISPPGQTFNDHQATVYAGIGRTDEGAGCGGALRWTGAAGSPTRVGLSMHVGGMGPTDSATAGRSVRVFMPHMFNGSVPRVDVSVTQLYNAGGQPVGASRSPVAAVMQASAQADGSDMRFVVGAGPANGGAVTGNPISVTVTVRAYLMDKRVDGI